MADEEANSADNATKNEGSDSANNAAPNSANIDPLIGALDSRTTGKAERDLAENRADEFCK